MWSFAARWFLPCLLLSVTAFAQHERPSMPPEPTVFDHPNEGRFWLSGQVNLITQYHPRFSSPYAGVNSLRAHEEAATSFVATVYSAAQVTSLTDVILDVESAGGGGLGDALGVAGFMNLDVVRNPSLSSVPYIARAEIRQIIPLSSRWGSVLRGPFEPASTLPVRRLEIRAGKMSTADQFDVNAIASDSHLQFTNWAICNTGSYDYAADTRGYTPGVIVEYEDERVSARLGEMMMPTVANGSDYDTDIAQARGENLELELRHRLIRELPGTVRVLGFLNHARMGSYAEANDAFTSGTDAVPDITAHRHRGATRYGFVLNVEQSLTETLRGFVRLGWTDGRNEAFAYTEIENTGAIGFDLRGDRWLRPMDKLGAAFVTNGLGAGHRDYLALGGAGFLLGDGALTYGRESIVEAYYTALLFHGVSLAGDVQAVVNPGYNQDRGPVLVGSVRVHLEL